MEEKKAWVPNVFPKQMAVITDPKRYVLVSGPRYSGKTVACLHAVAWHLWKTPGARGVMIGRSIGDNLNEGAWSDLINTILPQWFEADFGMEFYYKDVRRGPVKMEPVSHRYYFEVTNQYFPELGEQGGISRMYLDSLKDESEVERYRNRRFSLIWMTELSNFKRRHTFDVLQECLRCMHLTPEQHKFISDTNPADEGEDSWIYKLWYYFRKLNLDHLEPEDEEYLNLKDIQGVARTKMLANLRNLQKELSVHEIHVGDNAFISDEQKAAQQAKYAHNPDLYRRFYLGQWVRATSEAIFAKVWKPTVHIIGGKSVDFAKPDRELEDTIMLPEENTTTFIMGWDIGSVRNHAVIGPIEKIQIEYPDQIENGKPRIEVAFKVLDEFVSINQELSLKEITEEIMEIMDFWEQQLGRKALWRHWSDTSAFDYKNIADSYESKEIYRFSNGRIVLQKCQKGDIESRVDFITRLLHQDRLFISGPRCQHLIEMFESFRRTRAGKIDKASPLKHSFDALSYAICMEAWNEMMTSVRQIRVGKNPASGSIIVTNMG